MADISIDELRKQFTERFNPDNGNDHLRKAIDKLNEAEVRALQLNITTQEADLEKYDPLLKIEGLKAIVEALKEMYKQTNILYIHEQGNVSKSVFDKVISTFSNSIQTLRGNVAAKITANEGEYIELHPPEGETSRKYLKYKTKYLTLRDKLNV